MIDKKLFYNTILCQTFSPDGRYLIAGNIYGYVSVFDITDEHGACHNVHDNQIQGPKTHFKAYQDQGVQSMVKTENFLVTATSGVITGWDWKNIISSKIEKVKPSWCIQIPCKKDSIEKPDTNCMAYTKENNNIYAGCGDSKIHAVDLEYGKIQCSFVGHENFIHSIAVSNKQIISGSEDGTVRLWDVSKKENTNILQPHLHDRLARPKIGKWIGAVDKTDDWLLCGGGPKLSLWHMRSMELATVFDIPDDGIHVAAIQEERIIAGGVMPYLYQQNYQGTPLAKIPVSSNTIYSVAYQEQPKKILSIAGTSNQIDICTNSNYREFTLKFM